jgi:hypothetical protein
MLAMLTAPPSGISRVTLVFLDLFCSSNWAGRVLRTHRLLADGSLNAVRFIFRNALPTRWAVLGRAGIDNESDQVT